MKRSMHYKDLALPSLIDKCCQKDPRAFAEFIVRFSPFLKFAIRKALSRYSPGRTPNDDIKDIEHDIITSILEKNRLREVKNPGSINYWLAIVARNATINRLRSGKWEIPVGDSAYFDNLPASGDRKEAPGGNEVDYREKLDTLFVNMPPKERIIFDLFFIKRISQKNIAGILSVPEGTVSSTIARARKRLERKL